MNILAKTNKDKKFKTYNVNLLSDLNKNNYFYKVFILETKYGPQIYFEWEIELKNEKDLVNLERERNILDVL